MPYHIKGVAFDLEGTIIDNEQAHHWGWIRAAAEYTITIKDPEEALELCPNFSGGPERTVAEQILALAANRKRISEEMIEDIIVKKWRHYHNLLPTIDLRPRLGFLEIYEKFQNLGIPMTIATAVELDKALPLFRLSGLDGHFSLRKIVFLSDVKNPKPAPDCFIKTAEIMKIHPSEQLVFEDSPRGATAGFRAGSIVVGIPVYDTDTVNGRLKQAGARYLFHDWRKINIENLLRCAR